MKVEKLPSGNYRVQKCIDGVRRSFTFDHRPTQKEINAKIYSETYEPDRDSFNSCALKYIAINTNVLSPSTIRSYEAILRALPEDFKKTPINKITDVTLQSLINNISANHTPKTVRNYNGFIMAVLNKFLPKNNLSVTLPKKKKPDDYIPSPEDVRRVLEQAKGTPYYLPIVLGCYGLRKSEIAGLTMDDIYDTYIDINKVKVVGPNGLVTKDIGKTDASLRRVAVSPDIIAKIREQGYILNTYPDKILVYLNQFQDKAGVPRFRFHLLRHFFCTELFQAGYSEEDIMALGGWSTSHVMKKVYRHQRILEDEKKQSEIATKILQTISP
jgi:integrase